jgi:membrane-bound metal-dependent hydrolase YbcI (DUF457 family)
VPSPVGHALGGAIVGELSASRSGHAARRLAITCAIVACLPDLDFLWGRHNMETHSLGAAVCAGLVTLVLTRGRDPRLAIAVVLAWTSHVLFDWLGSDTTPPLGVMALWPLSNDYYFSNAFVFEAISRRYWLDNFWRHNIMAVGTEVVILVPVLALVRWLRRAGLKTRPYRRTG